MKLAIMQPYLFPYIGYFQLLNAVDKFVIYDDVTYIKQGWINRNNILINGKAFLFTIPLKDASSFKWIRDTEITGNSAWESKLTRTIEQSYKKAPYYSATRQLIESVISTDDNHIAVIALKALKMVCAYIGINTSIVDTSLNYANNYLHAQARVIDICKIENATQYINSIGGMELYSKEAFAKENINLSFIKSKISPYKQFSNNFVPALSIIDVMMFNSPTDIKTMLEGYELL